MRSTFLEFKGVMSLNDLHEIMLILKLNMEIKIQCYIIPPTSYNTGLSGDEYD